MPSKYWLGGYSPVDHLWWYYSGEINVEIYLPSKVIAGRQVPIYGTFFGRQTTYARFVTEHQLTGGGWW